MNPMIEAAARAMYEVRASRLPIVRTPRDNWDELHPGIRDLLREEATAALRAMMECAPSEAMYFSWLACYGNYVYSEDDLRTQACDTWRALLGTIIGEVE